MRTSRVGAVGGAVLLWIMVTGAGLASGETVPVRADDGTLICPLYLPPGWELVATPSSTGGLGLWQPPDAGALWGVPIGVNGGGNSVVHRGSGLAVGALTLGSAASPSDALRRLQMLVPDFAALQTDLGEPARQALGARRLESAAYECDEGSVLLLLGRPGQRWVALVVVARSGRPAMAEVERLLAGR